MGVAVGVAGCSAGLVGAHSSGGFVLRPPLSSLLHYSGNTGNSPRVLNVGGVTLLHCYRVTLLPCGHISSIVGVCAVGPLCRLLSPLHLISRRCTELSLSLRVGAGVAHTHWRRFQSLHLTPTWDLSDEPKWRRSSRPPIAALTTDAPAPSGGGWALCVAVWWRKCWSLLQWTFTDRWSVRRSQPHICQGAQKGNS